MSKVQTDSQRYPSPHGGGFVSGSQYIVELLCECLAQQQHKTLPHKFWSLPEWSTQFKRHIRDANLLLKTYTVEQISEALKDKSVYWQIKYFGNKNFKSVLQRLKEKVDIPVVKLTESTISLNENAQPNRKSIAKKNTLSLLK
jgi:hypothetical protein